MELEQVAAFPKEDTELNDIEAKDKGVQYGAEHAEAGPPVSAFSHLTVGQTFRLFKKNIFICMLVLFITANDGYQLTLPGQLIANTGFLRVFGTEVDGKYVLGATSTSTWNALYNVGYIVSLLLAGFPNDYAGRKAGMFVLGLSCVLATILSLTAKNVATWGVAKLFNGTAVGFAQATLTAYVSEMAPTQVRGALLNVYSIFFAVGQFTAAICLYALQIYAPMDYKRAIQTEWIWSGIFIAIWLYVPESPHWLIRKGKTEQAKKVLKRVNGNVPGYDVEHEYKAIEYIVQESLARNAANAAVDWRAIYRGINRRRTFISFFPLAIQQLIGIPVVFGYTSVFFAEAGLSNPFIGTVITYLILIIFICVSFYTVERIGRRPIFLVNGFIMTAALAIIGVMGTIKTSHAVSTVTIVMMCLWVAAYATSAGPLGYVFLGESSTPALRAKTTSHAAAGTGLFGLIFGYTTPYMLFSTGGGAGWGLKTAYFYAGTAILSLVIFYFTIPETKGRSYAALDELFERNVPARQFKNTTTSIEQAAETKTAQV